MAPQARVFKVLDSDSYWTPFTPYRVVLQCVGDMHGDCPKHWRSLHDYSLVYSVDGIGSREPKRLYRCTWRMKRCEFEQPVGINSKIRVYLKPRSPFPWYLTLAFFFRWRFAMPIKFQQLDPQKGEMIVPPGTGSGPHIGVLTIDFLGNMASPYHDSESVLVGS